MKVEARFRINRRKQLKKISEGERFLCSIHECQSGAYPPVAGQSASQQSHVKIEACFRINRRKQLKKISEGERFLRSIHECQSGAYPPVAVPFSHSAAHVKVEARVKKI